MWNGLHDRKICFENLFGKTFCMVKTIRLQEQLRPQKLLPEHRRAIWYTGSGPEIIWQAPSGACFPDWGAADLALLIDRRIFRIYHGTHGHHLWSTSGDIYQNLQSQHGKMPQATRGSCGNSPSVGIVRIEPPMTAFSFHESLILT